MIRVAGRDDVADVVRLLLEFREWYGRPVDDAARERFTRAVSALVGAPDTEYLLGGSGPDAVAQVRYRLSVWTGVEDCWLEDLFVSEAARGEGLGREMVAEVLSRARARGCARVELDTDVTNGPARALYASLGFRDKTPGGTLFLQCWL